MTGCALLQNLHRAFRVFAPEHDVSACDSNITCVCTYECVHPRPDGVWRVTRPDEAAPSVSSKVIAVE